jgi:FKBP-type peptidyl-prolyl cis-trans isomerase FklB
MQQIYRADSITYMIVCTKKIITFASLQLINAYIFMKKTYLSIGFLIVTLLLGSAEINAQTKTKKESSSKEKTTKSKGKDKSKPNTTMTLNTALDSVSYSLGVNIAENLANQGIKEVNVDALARGMDDFIKKNNLQISQAEANTIINNYLQAKQMEQRELASKEGKDFLANNAKRKEVVTLPSGLQYEILIPGTGPLPKPSDKVTTHYHGTLIDGTVFDSSVERGQPATFGVTQVIQGWQEALQLMPQGSKWRLYIPYNLAYGERGAGGKIGPYAALIFDIELISIAK